jgi:hypothetical protein
MRSCGRLGMFVLLAAAGLIIGDVRPKYARSAARTDMPTGPLAPGTVTVGKPTTCPAGAATGENCEEITVSCTGLPPLGAILGVATPTAPLIGTIILHGGGPGTNFLDNGFPNTYLAAGFNVVQIAWASDWATANGSGVKNAACRPATVFDYVFRTVHGSSRSIGFCGQGASGGGAALGYSLADYGLSDEFDYVVIAAGPSVSRMDYGCDPPLTTAPSLCSLADAPYAYSPSGARKVDAWEGTTTCGASQVSQSDLTKWAGDSIVSEGGNYTYPQTGMSWFFCINQPNESTGQGSFLISQVMPKNSPPDVNCFKQQCQGEGVWQNTSAVDLTVNRMLSRCKPNH